MPRNNLPKLSSITDGSFEPKRKNNISLRDDEPLDENLKVLKIGDINTPLELSDSEVKINGDLFLNGKLSSHIIECDNDYLEFRPNIYTRFESKTYTGLLDLYTASSVTYFLNDGAHFHFITEDAGTFKIGSLATSSSIFIYDVVNTKLQIRDDEDTGDLFTIEVAQHGATTISTTDDDATAGHLTLDVDGDITLDPAGADIHIDKDGTNFGSINTTSAGKFKIIGATDYQVELHSQGGGDISLQSADNILIDAVDTLTLDSDGTFAMKKDGTEYSVANSAYAGMILGYRMIGEDAGHSAQILTTSYVVPDSAMTVRFVAPPSGNVEVMVQVLLDGNSNRTVTFGLSDNATYNSIGDSYEQITGMADETDKYTHQHYWTVTGLTAGDTYNYWFGASANGGNISWGGTGTDRFCDFIMKVTALPTATSDFAEYD